MSASILHGAGLCLTGRFRDTHRLLAIHLPVAGNPFTGCLQSIYRLLAIHLPAACNPFTGCPHAFCGMSARRAPVGDTKGQGLRHSCHRLCLMQEARCRHSASPCALACKDTFFIRQAQSFARFSGSPGRRTPLRTGQKKCCHDLKPSSKAYVCTPLSLPPGGPGRGFLRAGEGLLPLQDIRLHS